jgi:tRNA G18 (ribose-2'-O)-methylase SpoU
MFLLGGFCLFKSKTVETGKCYRKGQLTVSSKRSAVSSQQSAVKTVGYRRLTDIISLNLPSMRKLLNEELGRKTQEEFHQAEKTPVIILLDDVRSMNNVGSVFRTADAFLIEAIYLCGFTPVPPHREIQKTALGATETVKWKHFPSALEALKELKKDGWKIYSLEQAEKSISLSDFVPGEKEKIVLIFGNEVEGVRQELINESDAVIEIPQYGMKHSLNISVSAGIVIWDIVRKMDRHWGIIRQAHDRLRHSKKEF